ncbi:hypothetical protein [Acinetobacter baumannii]|uniref:hypothetical protein n=1 Tax=Acinetobacter baumannii TaxID=470 RepID=UPI00114E91AF|nr:hypothetical protein [Acinetobacter baumannii]MDP7921659.1 hypothetical protein [Acinetobacter baumannii]TQF20642.1 hypothetical protein FJU44_16635 [Acinetobacter baumannii]
MIDPSIITRGAERAQLQQQQNMEMLGNLGGALGEMVLGRRINQMRQLKTPEEQNAFANDSIFAPQLNQVLKGDRATAQKNAIDLLKAQSEIGKTNSEATKNNAQAGGFTLDNSQKKYGAIQGAFQQGALNGDKGQVLLALDAMKRTGIISPEDYDHNASIVSVMKPEEIKQYGMNSGLLNKELAPFLYQTKNNEADNATSRENNQATVNATLTGQKLNYQLGKEKLDQDKIIEDQKRAFERGEVKETIVGTDGKAYILYKDGRVELSKLPNGQAITPQSKRDGKPQISDKALESVNGININLSNATQNTNKINGLISDIQSGKLDLSAANQLGAKAKNFVGMSDENSRGVENFHTAINQAANDILMMAKGTQTEGDAKRALEVIAANPPRDNAAALQVLQRLATVQQNTISALNQNRNAIYDNYGVSPPQAKLQQPAQSSANQAKLNNILFGR